MTSIPLLCNICPREPEFSDISHLLTHIASKGHLAHVFKAQLRGRQEPTIRQKLDVYERWKAQYQIDKLLSERMMIKESMSTGGRTLKSTDRENLTTTRPRPAKPVKARKQRVKASPPVQPRSSPVKSEDLIDPQLSQSLLVTSFDPHRPSPFLDLPHYDSASEHRSYIPRMYTRESESPLKNEAADATKTPKARTRRRASSPHLDTDSASDYFQAFIRSPTAYPDPAELTGLGPGINSEITGSYLAVPEPDGLQPEKKADLSQSPILKGVKWPGMSLFDSASLEAQRRRNQRKDGSILEQMEHNSVVVEQIERIFWPDGTLKKQRIITGNVESSPIKEPTPPPKPGKRRRTQANKTVLKDVSTNAPKITGQKPRVRKTKGPITPTEVSDLRDLSQKVLARLGSPDFVYPRSAHLAYGPTADDEVELNLTRGKSSGNGRRPAFEVYNDNGQQSLHSHVPQLSSRRIPSTPVKPYRGQPPTECQPYRSPWDSHFHSPVRTTYGPAVEDRENIEPVLDADGRVDDNAFQANTERVTQRYFSVATHQPPQFFSTLPPQMEFGGLAESRYYGATLNPLNPYLRQHFYPRQTSSFISRPATGLLSNRNGSTDKPKQRASDIAETARRT